MVGEGLDVLAQAASIVHDMERKAQPAFEPIKVVVDAGRLPMGVGEYGAVVDRVECPLARHECHDGGLDVPVEAEGLTWAEIARRVGISLMTLRLWWKAGIRPNYRHLHALLSVANSLGLGHLFTD